MSTSLSRNTRSPDVIGSPFTTDGFVDDRWCSTYWSFSLRLMTACCREMNFDWI